MMNRNKMKNIENKKKEVERVIEPQRVVMEDKENVNESSVMKKEFLKRLYSRDRSKSKEKETYQYVQQESVKQSPSKQKWQRKEFGSSDIQNRKHNQSIHFYQQQFNGSSKLMKQKQDEFLSQSVMEHFDQPLDSPKFQQFHQNKSVEQYNMKEQSEKKVNDQTTQMRNLIDKIKDLEDKLNQNISTSQSLNRVQSDGNLYNKEELFNKRTSFNAGNKSLSNITFQDSNSNVTTSIPQPTTIKTELEANLSKPMLDYTHRDSAYQDGIELHKSSRQMLQSHCKVSRQSQSNQQSHNSYCYPDPQEKHYQQIIKKQQEEIEHLKAEMQQQKDYKVKYHKACKQVERQKLSFQHSEKIRKNQQTLIELQSGKIQKLKDQYRKIKSDNKQLMQIVQKFRECEELNTETELHIPTAKYHQEKYVKHQHQSQKKHGSSCAQFEEPNPYEQVSAHKQKGSLLTYKNQSNANRSKSGRKQFNKFY